jgi:hypothetical protein
MIGEIMIMRVITVLCLATLFVSCSCGQMSEDVVLERIVRQVVRQRIGISRAEEFVGKKATLNTSRNSDERDALHFFDIVGDIEKNEVIPDLENSSSVIFWVRPVDSDYPKIIGIVWDKKKPPQVFWGVIPDRS